MPAVSLGTLLCFIASRDSSKPDPAFASTGMMGMQGVTWKCLGNSNQERGSQKWGSEWCSGTERLHGEDAPK